MAKTQSVHVPFLHRKLNYLFQVPRSAVKSPQDLANYLGIARSTVQLYLTGDPNKYREPGHVSPAALRRLCDLLIETASSRITAQRAEALWRFKGYQPFESALSEGVEVSIDALLAGNGERIGMSVGVLDPARRDIVDDPVELPPGGMLIDPGQLVYFELEVRLERYLHLFCQDHLGWRPLVPGSHHAGLVKSRRERIPSTAGSGFSFSPPYGLERFVFIETEAPEPLHLRARHERGPLTPAQVEQLCFCLSNDAIVRAWRWNEAFVSVRIDRDDRNGSAE